MIASKGSNQDLKKLIYEKIWVGVMILKQKNTIN